MQEYINQCGTRQTSTTNILTPSIPLCKLQKQNYAKPYRLPTTMHYL